MRITEIKADGFKNLHDVDIKPHEKLNIIFGDNAQGKTNLIEAVWLCTGAKSFRNTKDKSMIDVDSDNMEINLSFEDSFREQTVRIAMVKPNVREKNVQLNGVKLRSMSKLFGNLNCVVFTPEDLELSKGSPEIRRQFLDLSVSQIKHSYNDVIRKYETLIDQRNSLLKNINYGKSRKEELEVWDIQLAQLGAYISLLRYNYTKKLNIFCKRLYDEISKNRDHLNVEYNSTVYDDLEGRTDYAGDLANEYLDRLRNNLEDDLKMGFTGKGVHRDDLNMFISSKPVREFASQGQHRSSALVLKLAQAYILAEEINDHPCILLDDVLSELDESRQGFVISKIHDMQVFITCCDKNIPFEKGEGKIFRVEKGRLREFV